MPRQARSGVLPPGRSRPSLEALEDRILLAGQPLAAPSSSDEDAAEYSPPTPPPRPSAAPAHPTSAPGGIRPGAGGRAAGGSGSGVGTGGPPGGERTPRAVGGGRGSVNSGGGERRARGRPDPPGPPRLLAARLGAGGAAARPPA